MRDSSAQKAQFQSSSNNRIVIVYKASRYVIDCGDAVCVCVSHHQHQMHWQNHRDPMNFRQACWTVMIMHTGTLNGAGYENAYSKYCSPHPLASSLHLSLRLDTNGKLSRSHGKCDMNKRSDKQSSKSDSRQQRQPEQHNRRHEHSRMPESMCQYPHTKI